MRLFAGFAFYPFAITLSHKYDYMHSPLCPLTESPNLGVVLGTPEAYPQD